MHALIEWAKRHGSELRLSVRVAVAGLVAFALAELLRLPQSYWAVITAVIVTQQSVGGSLKAAVDRLAGTLAGAVCGAAVAMTLAPRSPLGYGAALLVALPPLGLLAALDAQFRIAPVTAMIVLLTATSQTLGPVHSALFRVMEIAVGSLIAMAVSLLVLPARAHRLVSEVAARILSLNADLLDTVLRSLTADSDRRAVPLFHARIRAALKQLETAADEARRERRLLLVEQADPEPLVRTLYRLRHDLVMLARAAATPLPEPVATHLGPALAAVRESAAGAMRQLAAAAAGSDAQLAASGKLAADLQAYYSAVDRLRGEGGTRTLSSEDLGRFFAIRFALEQLAHNLDDVGGRVSELRRLGANAEPPPSATKQSA